MLKGLGKRLIVLAVFCIVSPVLQASLAGRINSVVNSSSQKKVEFGIKVLDPTTGKTLYARNSQTPMIPASNMKIVASAAALERLGPDYKFTTRVGMLGNTLVVIGGGDPLFGDESTDARNDRKPGWVFGDIIAGIKALGITELDGIIIDSTFFDDNRVPETWPRDQLNRYYACETSGLNYNGNCIKLNVKRSGSSVKVSLDPATHYVKIVNQIKTSSRTNAVGAYRTTTPNELIVKGYCSSQAGFDVAIERPASFFGFVLAEKLNAAGIEIRGDLTEQYIKNQPGINIFRTYTTPIADVLTRCNQDSFGLAAESLIKTISAENTAGRINGEWPHGLHQAQRFLNRAGIKDAEFTLADGSGLSRKDRLSANALATVLANIYKSNDWPLYKSTLAVGGMVGSSPVRKYFTEKQYKGKVFAKSGTLDGVKALSGLCQTENGDIIFSIITNKADGNTRKAINDIVKAIFPK
jgi:D-alanyl-D-alanine carboxypeptidase/D-alanyl-D-alanine-endopeptidase (penicillin-binding protein 4)